MKVQFVANFHSHTSKVDVRHHSTVVYTSAFHYLYLMSLCPYHRTPVVLG